MSKLCLSMAKWGWVCFLFLDLVVFHSYYEAELEWSCDPSSEKLLCPHCVTPLQLCNCVSNHSKPRLRTLAQDFSCGSPEYIHLGNLLLWKKLGIPLSNIQKIVLKLGSRGTLGVTGEGAPGNPRDIRITISQSTGYNITDIQRN